jgi:hypothetical protein
MESASSWRRSASPDPLADQPEIEQMEIGNHRPNGSFRQSRLHVLRKTGLKAGENSIVNAL